MPDPQPFVIRVGFLAAVKFRASRPGGKVMISGRVDLGLEPVVFLAVHGEAGRERSIPFVLDTGYNGVLSLPPALIQELQLAWCNFTDPVAIDCSILGRDVSKLFTLIADPFTKTLSLIRDKHRYQIIESQ